MIDRINLVPQKPLSAKLQNKVPLITGLLLLLVVVIVFTQNRFLSHDIESSENEFISLKQKAETFTQIQAKVIKKKIIIDQLTEQYNKIAVKVRQIEDIQQKKNRFSALLSEISMAQPPSIISKKIVFSKGIGEIVGVARGYEDLPEFVETLNNSGMFNNITLKAIVRETNSNEILFEFNIIGEINESST